MEKPKPKKTYGVKANILPGALFAVPTPSGKWGVALIVAAGQIPKSRHFVLDIAGFGPLLESRDEAVVREFTLQDAVMISSCYDTAIVHGVWKFIGMHPRFMREEWPILVKAQPQHGLKPSGHFGMLVERSEDPSKWIVCVLHPEIGFGSNFHAMQAGLTRDEFFSLPLSTGTANHRMVELLFDRVIGERTGLDVLPECSDRLNMWRRIQEKVRSTGLFDELVRLQAEHERANAIVQAEIREEEEEKKRRRLLKKQERKHE